MDLDKMGSPDMLFGAQPLGDYDDDSGVSGATVMSLRQSSSLGGTFLNGIFTFLLPSGKKVSIDSEGRIVSFG